MVATSMKQSRGHQGSQTEELAKGKMLPPMPNSLAAKILASDGLAPDGKATIKALKYLLHRETMPLFNSPNNIESTSFQFCRKDNNEQLIAFNTCTAARPSNMYHKHLLNSVAPRSI